MVGTPALIRCSASAAGKITMVVERAGLASVAAGDLGHGLLILDEEPGFPAMQRFHAWTMQRLGAPCAPVM